MKTTREGGKKIQQATNIQQEIQCVGRNFKKANHTRHCILLFLAEGWNNYMVSQWTG